MDVPAPIVQGLVIVTVTPIPVPAAVTPAPVKLIEVTRNPVPVVIPEF